MQYDSPNPLHQVHRIRISMLNDTMLIQARPVGRPEEDARLMCIQRPALLSDRR